MVPHKKIGEQFFARLWFIQVKLIYGPTNLRLLSEISNVHLSGLLMQLVALATRKDVFGSVLQAQRL